MANDIPSAQLSQDNLIALCTFDVVLLNTQRSVADYSDVLLKSAPPGRAFPHLLPSLMSTKTYESTLRFLLQKEHGTTLRELARADLARTSRPLFTHPPPAQATRVAVLIEGKIRSTISYVVRNAMHFLGPAWAVEVHHSALNAAFVRHQLADLLGVKLVQQPLSDLPSYNSLLTSPRFWASFAAEKVLIFQSDSFFLRAGIDEFFDFDFIGAPWCSEWYRNDKVLRYYRDRGQLWSQIGNGGFSLRTRQVMLNISLQHANTTQGLPEDMFFALHLEGRYRLPDFNTAFMFSRENFCKNTSSLEASLPLALHAFPAISFHDEDRYLKQFSRIAQYTHHLFYPLAPLAKKLTS